jgi:hypothetical protein
LSIQLVEDDVPPTSFIIDLLSATSSSNLLSISIVLYYKAPEIAAEELDQVLAHPRFSGLRSFSVGAGGNPDDKTLLTRKVRIRMPLATARGILK